MDPQRDTVPTPEDFSGKSIEKFVLKYAVTHPATLFPLGVAALAGLVAAGTTSVEGLIGAMFFTALGVGHGVFRYFFQGEDIARKRVDELRARLDHHKQTELHALMQDFSGEGFREGVDIVNRLITIHRQVVAYLKDRINQNTNAARFLALSNDTYEQGLRIAKQACVLHRALQKLDLRKLKKEFQTAQEQLESSDKEYNGAIYQSSSRKVKTCQARLDRYKEYEDRLLNVMEHGERMIEALENAYVDVGTLVEKTEIEFNESDSAQKLEVSIEAVRQIQKEVYGLNGREEKEEDGSVVSPYREAGRRSLEEKRNKEESLTPQEDGGQQKTANLNRERQ